MSQFRGSFSGRGSHPRWNRHGQRKNAAQSESSDLGQHGYSKGRGKGRGYPAGLTGKEIGMYFRSKAMAKAKKRESPLIKLPITMQRGIESMLENFNGFYDDPYNSELQAENTDCIFENKYTHIQDSLFKKKFLRIVSGDIQNNLLESMLIDSKLERNSDLDEMLLNEYKTKQTMPKYKSMMKIRMKLPAYEKKAEILQLIRDNQILVISGETGCGKTTQVAQFILDDQIENSDGSLTRIVCTQPRRISAISVAERVAAERAEELGNSVGFQIRLEKVPPRDKGSILFCTTGVLLQYMQSDPALKDFSHVILDEIHERSTQSDFLICLLKMVIPKRRDLKVILMSATLNSERFSEYYNNCPITHIPGFTYPVEEFYLEDVLLLTQFEFPKEHCLPLGYKKHLQQFKNEQKKRIEFLDLIKPHVRQLIAEKKYPKSVTDQLENSRSEELSLDLIERLIRHICSTKGPGAILVFLPGMMDISKLNRMMLDSPQYPAHKYLIYPLHSRMPTVDQKRIFEEPPPGVRKIIIATSIAETSITIEDVVYVIDCGKTKLQNFDITNNIQTLNAEWVSLANAKQRRGRAGRVKPGYCYHLYSKAREMVLEQYPLPEILRTRLEEVILQIKILQLGKVKSFLATVMDPPDLKAIDLSLELLRTLNALDKDENLTPLGYHLAQLPLDPRTGKMVIWAALFSCVEPVFAIAASLTFRDAFYTPLGKEEEAKRKKLELSLGHHSDHIALAEALGRFNRSYRRGTAHQFCRDYFLSFNTLKLLSEMTTQFAQHLHEMKFLDSSDPTDANANRNSDNIELVKAIVCAGSYPNVAEIRSSSLHGLTRAWTAEDGSVTVHPSSVNDKVTTFPTPFLTYFTKQKSSAIYLHDTTCVTAPILLFAAPNMSIKKEHGKSVISLPGSQNFVCELHTAKLIQRLQETFNKILKYKITHPGTVSWSTCEGDLINAIIEVVSLKDEEMELYNSDVDGSLDT